MVQTRGALVVQTRGASNSLLCTRGTSNLPLQTRAALLRLGVLYLAIPNLLFLALAFQTSLAHKAHSLIIRQKFLVSFSEKHQFISSGTKDKIAAEECVV